jgi:hypothetical protein
MIGWRAARRLQGSALGAWAPDYALRVAGPHTGATQSLAVAGNIYPISLLGRLACAPRGECMRPGATQSCC